MILHKISDPLQLDEITQKAYSSIQNVGGGGGGGGRNKIRA